MSWSKRHTSGRHRLARRRVGRCDRRGSSTAVTMATRMPSSILMDEGSYPTSTASDWVTFADHVVVGTVTERDRAGSAADGRQLGLHRP